MGVYRLGILLVAAGSGCVLAVPDARADLYKWTDENGVVTYSSFAPRDRSRILEVFPSNEWSTSAPDPPRASQQTVELRALADRIDRLTAELEAQRRDLVAAESVPPPQYVPSDADVGGGWIESPLFAPTTVVVTPFIHHHRFRRFDHFRPFNHFERFPHRVFHSPSGAFAGGGMHFHTAGGSFRMR